MLKRFLSPAPPAVLTLNGRDVPLTVRRNKRARRITLRYQPVKDTVLLSLPWRAPLAQGMAFLREKESWLARQALPQPQLPESGFLFRGERLTLVATGQTRGLARLEGDKLLLPGAPEHVNRRLKDWLKAQAREAILPLVARHAASLNVKPGRVTLRDTTSRWGSCAADGSLSFSWRLILAPPEVLDYVVCHEVAHLKEMNHSPSFWNSVGKICPQYRQRSAWLKRNGRQLYNI